MSSIELQKLETFRTSHCEVEIEDFLRYFFKCNLDLTVWQNLGDTRHLWQFRIIDLDPHEQQFKITPVEGNFKIRNFESSLPLNIFCAYKQFITKSDILHFTKDSIALKLPEKIHTEELRRKPRKQFFTNDRKVKFQKQNKHYEYPLLDISESGMAFSVPKGPAKIFNYADDEIIINNVFEKSLPSFLRANVVYIQHEEEDRFRVGIKFQRNFHFKNYL